MNVAVDHARLSLYAHCNIGLTVVPMRDVWQWHHHAGALGSNHSARQVYMYCVDLLATF